MAKFKGRIIFEVKFEDMHIPLFGIPNIVQKVALHKCSQQIQCFHQMTWKKDRKHLYQKNVHVAVRIKEIEIDE